jgi:predicted transcriptional regulator
MTEATFTFRLEEDLKAAFAEAAKAQDRTGAQLLRDYMRDVVRQQQEKQHDLWLRQQIEAAIVEADSASARFIDNEEVEASWAEERAALSRRISSGGQ